VVTIRHLSRADRDQLTALVNAHIAAVVLHEIRWLVARPDAPAAAAELMATLDVDAADGALHAPFVYGVPDVWPHIRVLYADAGFVPSRVEVVLVADVD
jgi:hypothetical protein